ncbi:general transcription factor II-I repeat domain-containing protein 2 [Trichonephila clavipes]|nr:general transcription factor II-I repeat domain-containing protein 2 [Trichonephila clavipes]
MQYHGVGRHHNQWPHAPTCGCEWDYDCQRYIDEVLLPHVRLFRGAVGDKFVFMDDNATCHRTLAVQDCLDSEGIQRLVWPARSLDLNPIENVWDALGRQVAGRNCPPTNKNTLIRALTEEWDKLPQQLLDNVVQSMVRRVTVTISKTLIAVVEEICPEKLDLFTQMSLSRQTVERRIENISREICASLNTITTSFVYFSLALDETSDINDTAQLAIFIRGIDSQMTITEELLELVSLKGITTGRDIKNAVINCAQSRQIDLKKNLVGIATDGAPGWKKCWC